MTLDVDNFNCVLLVGIAAGAGSLHWLPVSVETRLVRAACLLAELGFLVVDSVHGDWDFVDLLAGILEVVGAFPL